VEALIFIILNILTLHVLVISVLVLTVDPVVKYKDDIDEVVKLDVFKFSR
jgi:hypothetical protein